MRIIEKDLEKGYILCPNCNGTGKVKVRHIFGKGWVRNPCSFCNGSGQCTAKKYAKNQAINEYLKRYETIPNDDISEWISEWEAEWDRNHLDND